MLILEQLKITLLCAAELEGFGGTFYIFFVFELGAKFKCILERPGSSFLWRKSPLQSGDQNVLT